MAINLSRNTKVYYTTVTSGFNSNNTTEIQVTADYSFSQNTEQQTITLNEAGATPTRGQRSFNTKLAPVDWSFAMYVRPYALTAKTATATAATAATVSGVVTATITSAGHTFVVGDEVEADTVLPEGSVVVQAVTSSTFTIVTEEAALDLSTATFTSVTKVTAGERLFWNTLASANAIGEIGAGWVESAPTAIANFTNSNVHQLSSFNLIFKTDTSAYLVQNCSINQAEVSFAIDQIAMINFSGNGTVISGVDTTGLAQLANIAPAGTILEDNSAGFITNKLSIITIEDPIAVKSYNVPITGGTLTINNNIQYLTPDVLGVVNKPVTYFTGTRAISGSLNAYLRAGNTGDASDLYTDLTADAVNSPDNLFKLVLKMGGGTGQRVEFELPYTMLQIPTIDVQDVISTTINFTAQGGTGTTTTSAFDITAANELTATYYPAA